MYLSWWWPAVLTVLGALGSSRWAVVDGWRHNHSLCPACAEQREQFAKLRLEQIMRELLDKLGLDAPPQVRPEVAFPAIPSLPQMNTRHTKSHVRRDVHSSFLADEPYIVERDQQKTERTILLASKAPARYDQNLLVAHFHLSAEVMSKALRTAELFVYIRRPSRHPDPLSGYIPLQIKVWEVLSNASYGDCVAERKIHVDPRREEYMRVLLRTDDIQRWWEEGSKHGFLGLYVEAMYKGENLAMHPQQDPQNLMYLELTSDDEWARRKRSSSELCTREMNEPSCCLYSLLVDFEEAGWDFVIAPKVYNAQMCSGECKLHYPDRSVHSKMTSQTTNNTVSGCCHPSEYDSLTLVYMTQEMVVKIKEVPGMIARRCTCA